MRWTRLALTGTLLALVGCAGNTPDPYPGYYLGTDKVARISRDGRGGYLIEIKSKSGRQLSMQAGRDGGHLTSGYGGGFVVAQDSGTLYSLIGSGQKEQVERTDSAGYAKRLAALMGFNEIASGIEAAFAAYQGLQSMRIAGGKVPGTWADLDFSKPDSVGTAISASPGSAAPVRAYVRFKEYVESSEGLEQRGIAAELSDSLAGCPAGSEWILKYSGSDSPQTSNPPSPACSAIYQR